MTAEPRVSIVIVSRDRPAELERLLVSLRYLQFLNFEVIVVTKDDPRALFPEIHAIERVKFIKFDQANISAARNLGISQAKGEIVAFCDDDAVPEPTWLNHLIAPFADKTIAAAGGYVLGRNGISFQWKGRSFDMFGNHSDLDIRGTAPQVYQGDAGSGIKTEGTNCAFRREVLLELGGFDENFRYYLDETDLNYRIALAGWKTAIVPLAQVHHGFSASKSRHKNRAPRTLFDIGASKAWYCKKHTPADLIPGALGEFCKAQRNRLLRFMVDGALEPRDVSRLERGLLDGIKAGLKRVSAPSICLESKKTPPLQRFLINDKPTMMIAHAQRKPRSVLNSSFPKMNFNSNTCVTIFMFSLSSIFHKMEFHKNGYWIQTGGLFGRSDRKTALFKFYNLANRAKTELSRISDVRPIATITPYSGFIEAEGSSTSSIEIGSLGKR